MASDEDLKLSDLLRYYDRNCQAALVSTSKQHMSLCLNPSLFLSLSLPGLGSPVQEDT